MTNKTYAYFEHIFFSLATFNNIVCHSIYCVFPLTIYHQFANDANAAELAHGHGGDGRLTFQLHGQKGPHSYRFGFDTGKG